jgi:chromosome partitioning protein
MTTPRIIAVAAQKGGAGKTTSTINLGAELAARGKHVLLVDLDPQGHLAEGLGIAAGELEQEISQVLDHKLELRDILVTIDHNLILAPANIHLAHLEHYLVTRTRREDRLKQALEPVQANYDIILIDCPPSLGILTVNALSAADEIIIPMAAEFYALLGVGLLLDTVAEMQRELNPNLSVTGILPTRMNRTNHAVEVVARAREELADLRVFATPIPEAVAVRDAAAAGKSLRHYAPKSPATIAYESVAKELCQDAS